jgi:large subunit ribosomal protein L32
MALPKRKISKTRRDRRRAHQKIEGTTPTSCPECGESMLPHHACPKCGFYKGRNVIEAKDE